MFFSRRFIQNHIFARPEVTNCYLHFVLANVRATAATRFDMEWVIKSPSQGAAAEMLSKTHDTTYSSRTPRGYCRQDLCL